MQKTSELKLQDKTIVIKFNLQTLLNFEKQIGHSINALFAFNTKDYLEAVNIEFGISGLMTGAGLTRDESFNAIQQYCDEGGILDDVYGAIITAIMATGLFTRGPKEAPDPVPENVTSNQ